MHSIAKLIGSNRSITSSFSFGFSKKLRPLNKIDVQNASTKKSSSTTIKTTETSKPTTSTKSKSTKSPKTLKSTLKSEPDLVSLYVHWPFCTKICPFCDFNKYLDRNVDQSGMKESLLKDFDYFVNKTNELKGHDNWKIHTIYFGGGTPSLAPVETIESVLKDLEKRKLILTSAKNPIEISLEANPTDVETSKLKAFHSIGINRLSLGVQSFDDKHLSFLSRNYTGNDARKALDTANKIFSSVSVDLMYGLGVQHTPEIWRKELTQFFKEYQPNHLSMYALTVEPNTPLFWKVERDEVRMPDEEESALLFDTTIDVATKIGKLNHYEVSSFAKNGFESNHNRNYWLGGDYIGIGPGASGRIHDSKGVRNSFRQTLSPVKWTNQLKHDSKAILEHSVLTRVEAFDEMLILALRTKTGLTLNHIQRLGIKLKSLDEFFEMEKLEKLRKNGLIEFDQNSLRATFPEGVRLLDTVILNVMLALKMTPEERMASESEQLIQETFVDRALEEARQESNEQFDDVEEISK